MSIASEITRLQSAKAELKRYLESVGIAISDDILIDGMVEQLASMAQPADYVVETGYASYWRWRKWESGFAECWYEGYCSAKSVTFQWGSIYTGNAANIHSVPYPIAFTENPDCIISNANAEIGNQWLIPYDNGTLTQTPSWQLARGTSGTSQGCDYLLYACGKWK